MTDKPRSLYEQLIELAEWIEQVGYYRDSQGAFSAGDEYVSKAADVRVTAERLKDRVLVKAVTFRKTTISDGMSEYGFAWFAGLPKVYAAEGGSTPEEAIANLQSLLDQQKG